MSFTLSNVSSKVIQYCFSSESYSIFSLQNSDFKMFVYNITFADSLDYFAGSHKNYPCKKVSIYQSVYHSSFFLIDFTH